MNRAAVFPIAALVLACTQMAFAPGVSAGPRDEMITRHAAANGVPEGLIRRVIHIESRGNPRIVSNGNYGLMQIRLGTARSMGYSGNAEGLLDAETNMTYAVKYLARAYRAAKCNTDRAITYYQRGFYGTALAKCSAPAEMQVANKETDALARSAAADTAPVDPSGVLQPRVVHVETFIKGKQVAPAPKPVKFEPVRVSTAQTERPAMESATQVIAALEPVATVPLPRVRPTKAPKRIAVAELPAAVAAPPATDQAQLPEITKRDVAQPGVKVAKLDASAPLPPVRPENGENASSPSEPKPQAARSKAKWSRHFRHRHAHHRAKAEKPAGLIAFLQKLTAPEKKSGRHRSR